MQAQLDQAYVRAPEAGQIMKINTRAGETVSSDGIMELGRTDQMYAVAEVYQSDINKVRSERIWNKILVEERQQQQEIEEQKQQGRGLSR